MTFPALSVSYVACVRPPGGRVPTLRRDTTWGELAEALTRRPRVRADVVRDDPADEKAARARHLPAWSPATFDPGWRSSVNATALSCIVLDHDDGAPLDLARRTWGAWAHVAHTSWSHEEASPRWRVVVPLARPVAAALWPRVWAWAHARAGGRADPACKDAARLYYMPALRGPDAPWEAFTHDGPPLDLDALDLPPLDLPPLDRPPARRPAPRVRDPGTHVGRMLARLYAGRRDVRERVAHALGADVTGAPLRADRVTCPRCGDASVWWYIEPGRMAGAACKHRNTCGWTGPLADLDPDRL